MIEQPEGIIITLSKQMFEDKGLRNWHRNFIHAMDNYEGKEPYTYWFRTSAQPKQDIPFLYLCIGNKIRYRCNLLFTKGAGEFTFPAEHGEGTTTLWGRAWLVCCGPVTIARRPFVERHGFQGFRYTQKLF